MKTFHAFAAGMCLSGAIYNAADGDAWMVLLLSLTSAANLWIARPAEKRVDA